MDILEALEWCEKIFKIYELYEQYERQKEGDKLYRHLLSQGYDDALISFSPDKVKMAFEILSPQDKTVLLKTYPNFFEIVSYLKREDVQAKLCEVRRQFIAQKNGIEAQVHDGVSINLSGFIAKTQEAGSDDFIKELDFKIAKKEIERCIAKAQREYPNSPINIDFF